MKGEALFINVTSLVQLPCSEYLSDVPKPPLQYWEDTDGGLALFKERCNERTQAVQKALVSFCNTLQTWAPFQSLNKHRFFVKETLPLRACL